MGSPLSPIVADLMLQKLEYSVIGELLVKPIFYYRFVDDIALAAPYSSLNDLLHKFNSFHPRLRFTMEVGGDMLNFLDLTLIKRDGVLIFNWYHTNLLFQVAFLISIPNIRSLIRKAP